MSVLKSKRKASQFEVFHHLYQVRRDITDLLLRDFGYSFEKAEQRLRKRFGGRGYTELTEKEQERYNQLKNKWEAFDDWFIYDERQVIVDCLREITKEVFIANSIYPTCMEELIQRRLHQDMQVVQYVALPASSLFPDGYRAGYSEDKPKTADRHAEEDEEGGLQVI